MLKVKFQDCYIKKVSSVNFVIVCTYIVDYEPIEFTVEDHRLEEEVRSKLDRQKRLAGTILGYLKSHGEVEVNELINAVINAGFEKEEVINMITWLRRAGEIYMPRPGRVALNK